MQPIVRIAFAALLLVVSFFAYKSFYATQADKPVVQSTSSSVETQLHADQTGTLGQLIEQAISSSNFADARWGVFVISLRDGKVLYSRNGEKLFTPASNMKLFTTAAAMDLLGTSFAWRTSVYANQQPDANGILNSDVILYGRGAPDLVSESEKENNNSLSELAGRLYQRGVRRVTGKIIGDESFFRGEPIGDGWQWNDLQWYFGAEASALTINSNQVDVSVTPPEKSNSAPSVRSSDTTGYVSLSPDMALVKSGEPFKLGIHRGLSDNQVRVWGEFPSGSKGYGAQLSVHNPALWCARLFVNALRKQGIVVDGQATASDSYVPASERFDPAHSNELAYVTSRPLSEIIKITNKHSNNLYAELILRTLGRERESMISDQSRDRQPEDDKSGTNIVRLWLTRNGVPTQGLAIHDGSGLSRLDLVTPESTARLLTAIWHTSSGQVFRDTLPVAGTDGTLQGRLKGLEKQIFAKTGSLIYDNSLSGYLLDTNGETYAFSIMCNDQTAPGSSIRVIDQIAGILASYPHFQANSPAK